MPNGAKFSDHTCYCKTCQKTMDAGQFYTSRRLDRYPPDGKLPECKKCITRHVNNWNPETFLPILEMIDIPYIEDEWNTLLERYGQDRTKLTGMTILGRYLSKMKLAQFKDYRWEDTDRIKEEIQQKQIEAMRHMGYTNEEIEDAIKNGRKVEKPPEPPPLEVAGDMTTIVDDTPPDFEDDLTEEDRQYLAIKWGRAYRTWEWVQLEKYYVDMTNAFDIQTPSHEDYLKLICKTSLKAHQLVDMGDVEGFQKMSRVYDTLMKSAKFTAVQNKAETGEFINSISEMVALCEHEGGFIPRFYTDKPQDKVDETLQDLRGYTHTLVTEEMNLGNLIESAVKALQREAEREEDEDIDDDDIDLTMDQIDELKDEEFQEHFDFLEDESEADAEALAALLAEDDE